MIVIPTEAYPLTWPLGVPRASSRRRSSFINRTTGDGIARVRNQLKLAHAKTVVISSNLPLRGDGFPRADGPQRPEGDVGVAVYWTRNEHRAGKWQLVPYSMPCDRWDRIADNLYAIALSIEALRGMDRWGAVSIEQAFAGFAALPPGSDEQIIPRQPSVDWRHILGGSWPDLEAPDLLAVAKSRCRRLITDAHPDAGGDVSRAAELNAAMEAAEQELTEVLKKGST